MQMNTPSRADPRFRSARKPRRLASHAWRALRGSLQRGGADRWVLVMIAAAALVSLFDLAPPWLPACAVCFGAAHAFIQRIDRGLPLAPIAALLASLQWLAGALWYYGRNLDFAAMGMAVDAGDYLAFATPATAAFVLGLLLPGVSLDQRRLMAGVSRRHFLVTGLVLAAVSLVADVAGRLGPPSLAFGFLLLSQLRYVGVLYLWFAPERGSRWLAALSLAPLLVGSAESAMFHDLLLWGGLLFCFAFAARPRSVTVKVLLIAGAAVGAVTLQGIKQSYREKVWNFEHASLSGEILLFWNNLGSVDAEALEQGVLARLNQAWIISHVMRHVPSGEPYANGGTVTDALVAAAVPRFLVPDKAEAGGRANFTRFTGLPLVGSTSMNLSLLGEGFANFGRRGSILFLFLCGAAMSLAIAVCFRQARLRPTFVFWMPLVFYQAIKAETDLAEILNQIVKGGLVAAVCFLAIEYFLPTAKTRHLRQPSARLGKTRGSGPASSPHRHA